MAKKTDHQPATKGDLADAVTGLRTELKIEIAAVRSELAAVKTELKGDIADVRSELAAVKTELKNDIKNLSGEILKIHFRMDRLETNMMTELRSFKSELLAAFEQSVVKGEKYDQKAVTHGAILTDHEDKLLNHENRITLLETKK
ncbi:MAG: hypothetical protein HY796_03450 [Elusimicrobia bacterium]|nr:hypothetical protein [Elusimicrobiota bacterium]